MSFSHRLTLSYEGTCYLGWQKTKMGPSIQETLFKALAQCTACTQLPEAASRTDRGVHAERQEVGIQIQTSLSMASLQAQLNALLPPDIRVLSITQAPPKFHPTLCAKAKEYHYRFSQHPVGLPMQRLYSWHLPLPLKIDAMHCAAQEFLGRHDFSAFANQKKEDPFCILHRVQITPLSEGLWQISLVGDRFLYKMARNLAGTLIWVGKEKISPDQIPDLLRSKDRKRAGMTAPAHGLYLHKVLYEYPFIEDT